MADRELLEIRRAFHQVLAHFNHRLSKLELRGWAGAVRSAELASFATMDADPQTVVNLEVTSGRWIVFQRGSCYMENAAGIVSVNLSSVVSGQTVGTIADTPFTSDWAFVSMTMPFCDFGDLVVTDSSATISLQVYGEGFDLATWTNLSLKAIPV